MSEEEEEIEETHSVKGVESLPPFLEETPPESDFQTEHFKFQGDILIIKAATHIYDEILLRPFTFETKKKLRDLVKDVSDALYRVTKFNRMDINYTMNDLTITQECLIFSLPKIDVTHNLNYILTLIDKMYFAAVKGAEGGFEREAGISLIHRQEAKYGQLPQDESTTEQPRSERAKLRR